MKHQHNFVTISLIGHPDKKEICGECGMVIDKFATDKELSFWNIFVANKPYTQLLGVAFQAIQKNIYYL